MKVAYIGNFRPDFSTENDIRDSLERMGHSVEAVQEEDIGGWRRMLKRLTEYSAILWTSTYDLQQQIGRTFQLEMLYLARLAGVPTIGIHLDRWWGLRRQQRIFESPFFRCEFVFTADGAHQKNWQAAGVNHHWSPPAIADRWAQPGEYDPMFASDVAFVGSWQGGYHPEWKHRDELVRYLRKWYGDRVRFWPRAHEPAVRGKRLADLYASAKVVVGDSCLVPTVEGLPMHSYCSDRVPESLGRGAFLLHPQVGGVVAPTGLFAPSTHLGAWPLGDWSSLRASIDYYLANDEERQMIAKVGQAHVAGRHTYSKRLQAIFDTVELP